MIRYLKRDSSLVDSSTILYNFYDSTSQNTMGQLVDLKLATEFIYDSSVTNYTTQSILSRINDAGDFVTAINSQNLIEENERRVYEVIIHHFSNPEITTIDTLTIMSISDIAAQCPYIGGPAVYQARALMMLINPLLKFDDDNYCASIQLRKAKSKSNNLKHYCFIYPNPTGTTVNLIYDLKQFSNGELIIYNSIGKMVKQFPLNINQTTYSFRVNDLLSGIYNCKLTGDDVKIDVIKLSVIK